MHIQGPLLTHLPLATKRHNRKPNAINTEQEQLNSSTHQSPLSRLEPVLDTEYIAAGEAFNFNEGALSAAARKALRGYWAVAQQGRFEWQRIDIYV